MIGSHVIRSLVYAPPPCCVVFPAMLEFSVRSVGLIAHTHIRRFFTDLLERCEEADMLKIELVTDQVP